MSEEEVFCVYNYPPEVSDAEDPPRILLHDAVAGISVVWTEKAVLVYDDWPVPFPLKVGTADSLVIPGVKAEIHWDLRQDADRFVCVEPWSL